MKTNKLLQLFFLAALGFLSVPYVVVLGLVYITIAGPESLSRSPVLSALALVVPVTLLVVPVMFYVANLAATGFRTQQITRFLNRYSEIRSAETEEQLNAIAKRAFVVAAGLAAALYLAVPLVYAVMIGFLGRLVSVHWSFAVGVIVGINLIVTYVVLKQKYGSVRALIRDYLTRGHGGTPGARPA